MSSKGRTRQLSSSPGMTPDMLRLINEQRTINRDFDRRKPITSPTFFNNNAQRPPARDNPRRIIFVKQSDGSFQGQYSDGSNWQTFLATTVSFATPAITYATTFGAGVASTTMRSDAQLKFPTALMSSANSSTLTLTDDATDQTLTGSLGTLKLISAANKINLDWWIGAGGVSAVAGTVLGFQAQSSVVGTALTIGLSGGVTVNDGGSYTGATHRAGLFQVGASTGTTFTTESMRALDAQVAATTFSTGTHTFTERTGFQVSIGGALQSGSGAVTVTDSHGIRVLGWPTLGTGGTQTNARSVRILMPTIGATIRRGFSLETVTSNLGTEAANVEGYYCEDITRGTAQRANFYAEGATTGTPTDVYGFFQGTAHVVGTNRYGARYTGATTGTPTLAVGVQVDAHAVGTTKRSFIGVDPAQFGGIVLDDATDIVLNTTTGSKMGTATNQKFALFNSTPVVQPAFTGTATSMAAGGGAAVDDLATFTGGTGATAYRIDDLVKCLKTLGVIKT